MPSRRNWLLVLWLVAVAIGVWIYLNWHVDRTFLGLVETRSHTVGAREPGLIAEMYVASGDRVHHGQVLAVLDSSDLKAERDALNEELAVLQTIITADRERYSLEYERLRMQLESDNSSLMVLKAELGSKSVELEGLNREIGRWERAEEDGLGHSPDLGGLIVRRDALARYIDELRRELRSRASRKASPGQFRPLSGTDNPVLNSMLGNRIQQVYELERMVALLEARMEMRAVIAPCDGDVVKILARRGDTVDAFLPIIEVQERQVSLVEMYLPELSDAVIETGMRVRVLSKRSGGYDAMGTVMFLHPGFSPMVGRLEFRGQVFWSRRVQIRLDEGHRLLPGEAVDIRLTSERVPLDDPPLAKSANAGAGESAGTPILTTPRVRGLQVPDELIRRTRFEPSGILWLADIERYLIVSDDTGYPSRNEHAPWLFLMDREGRIEPEPLVLSGVESLNDLEAVTAVDGEHLLLLSSQTSSRKGKRRNDRCSLLLVKRSGRSLSVEKRVNFFDLLMTSLDEAQRQQLGLGENDHNRQLILNIEGAAYRDNVLYLGLKQPLSEAGARVWRLNDPLALFETKRLLPGQLTLFADFDLRNPQGRNSGISDLLFDADGRLIVLSTTPGVGRDKQMGGVHMITQPGQAEQKQKALYWFPKLKPEGVCRDAEDGLLVVFDSDQRAPSMVRISTEQENR